MSAVRRFYKDPGSLVCDVEGCEKYKNSKHYCSMHEMRLHRTGTLERLPIMPLKLSDMTPFGLNLVALRFAHGMSADRLADKAETTAWTINMICRGHSCSLDLLWRIGAVFDVEAWRLLKPNEFVIPPWFVEHCR